MADTSADRSRDQMGRRRRNSHPARPMARLRTHARSTEDETRSAANVIS